jgi:hypothetical protein
MSDFYLQILNHWLVSANDHGYVLWAAGDRLSHAFPHLTSSDMGHYNVEDAAYKGK